MFSKVLVGNDGSEGAVQAVTVAIELVKRLGGKLHMVSVEELPNFPTSIDEVVEEEAEAGRRFERVIDHARAKAAMQGVELEAHVMPGHAVSSIVDFVARERFDLLVVGYMGHAALYNRVIGSTADRLVDYAPCTVMVVKRPGVAA